MIFLALKCFLESALKITKLGLILLSLIGSLLHSTNAFAETPIDLRHSYSGNLGFELAGGSLLQDPTDLCNVNDTQPSYGGLSNSIPNDANIIAAYLYWAGSGTPDTNVTLNGNPVFDSTPYTAQFITGFWIFTQTHDFFSGVTDVTSIVGNTGAQANKPYYLSDLTVDNGNPYCNTGVVVSGWALIIIYEHDSQPFQVANIFDGFKVFQNESIPLNLNNFTVSSNPSGKHAHITWEGEADLAGTNEQLIFNGTPLSDGSYNDTENQFNSVSNINANNAYSTDTLALDIDAYDISSLLSPGDTSATTTYRSGDDMVILSAEVITVSNIPVADLSVTTSTPTSWLTNSTASKTYTVSNNGPNDIPINSVHFSTTLPAGELSFAGLPADSDWSCTQSAQQLDCLYKPKLRSGWSDYITINFDVTASAGSSTNITTTVNHDAAPDDIFDNQQANNTHTFDSDINITSTAVVDLSASSKTYTDVSGDLLLAGDTLQYTITLSDASGLAVSGINITDNLPDNISDYRITSFPTGFNQADNHSTALGGSNSTGYLDLRNINLASNESKYIVLEVDINNNAEKDASLQNTATISYGSTNWLIDTGNITVVEPDLSPSTLDAIDQTGGLLAAGDTITATITLDDLNDLDISNLQVLMSKPSNIDSFVILTIPENATDTNSSNTQIDIQDIDFLSGNTTTINIDFTVDANADDGDSIDLSATLKLGALSWIINGPSLTVQSSTLPVAGNKPLYLVNNDLTRIRPSQAGSINIASGEIEEWAITPRLQSNLTLASGVMSLSLAIEGNQTNNNRSNLLTANLYYKESIDGPDIPLATGKFPSTDDNVVRYDNGEFYTETILLDLNAQTIIPDGSTLYLSIENTVDNGNTNAKHSVDIHREYNSFYSALTLKSKTVINVDLIQVWSAPFIDNTPNDFIDDSGAVIITSSEPDTTLSIRAIISDPFGAFDITAANVSVTKANGSSVYNNEPMTQIDDVSDDINNGSLRKIYEKTLLLSESENIGFWTIDVTGIEGVEGDVEHTNTISFQVLPFHPDITLKKSIEIISDPINLYDKPKAIPGAELTYTIKATNSGRGKSDAASIVIEDKIPESSELYISNLNCNNSDTELTIINNNNGPICFLTGVSPNASGLSLNFASLKDTNDYIWFAKDDKDFSYQPDDTTEYDSAIRFIRIKLNGELNNQPNGSANEPTFALTYKVKLQ